MSETDWVRNGEGPNCTSLLSSPPGQPEEVDIALQEQMGGLAGGTDNGRLQSPIIFLDRLHLSLHKVLKQGRVLTPIWFSSVSYSCGRRKIRLADRYQVNKCINARV